MEGKLSEHLPGASPFPQTLKLQWMLQSQAELPRPLSLCIVGYGAAWSGNLKINGTFLKSEAL